MMIPPEEENRLQRSVFWIQRLEARISKRGEEKMGPKTAGRTLMTF
jgi:hypothetical protein